MIKPGVKLCITPQPVFLKNIGNWNLFFNKWSPYSHFVSLGILLLPSFPLLLSACICSFPFFLVAVSFPSPLFSFSSIYIPRHKENEGFFQGASFNSRLSELESPSWVSESNLSSLVEKLRPREEGQRTQSHKRHMSLGSGFPALGPHIHGSYKIAHVEWAHLVKEKTKTPRVHNTVSVYIAALHVFKMVWYKNVHEVLLRMQNLEYLESYPNLNFHEVSRNSLTDVQKTEL